MKKSSITSIIWASMALFTVYACKKQPVQTTEIKWRTQYVRDTSTALCNRITNADSAIVYMDHLFVPRYSKNGITFNNPLEQTAVVWIPGVSSWSCIVQNYYCPAYLVGRDVEVAFALFAHPTQLEAWRNLSSSFTDQDKEWSLYVMFSGIYCQALSPIKIKNGKIIRAK